MDDAFSMSGHNRPPPDLLTGDQLRDKLQTENDALLQRRDELLAAGGRIPPVEDEDTARKVSDFVKQIAACSKAADTARVAAKEPYLAGGRGVDGFFKAISDPLDQLKKLAERKLTDYLRAKEAAERARREAAAREERERAEEARRRAEEEARAARDAQSLQDAIAAEREAALAEADAIKAGQAAEVKAAELSRTRGEFGAVSSLRTYWTFDGLDRASLDLEALRAHLPLTGLETAIRSFIRAGGRDLRGTTIYETTEAIVR